MRPFGRRSRQEEQLGAIQHEIYRARVQLTEIRQLLKNIYDLHVDEQRRRIES